MLLAGRISKIKEYLGIPNKKYSKYPPSIIFTVCRNGPVLDLQLIKKHDIFLNSMRRIRVLNEQDVKTAYCELAPKLTNYLLANGLEYTVACDIVQESFIRLWKKSGELSATDSISGFIFTVARNLRTDYYRRSKFMIYQDEIAESDAGMVDPVKNTSADLVYLRKRLQDAIAQLPEDMRTAYTLFQIARRSIREISELTGASESLVKVRIHRAKGKLQELLEDLKKSGEI